MKSVIFIGLLHYPVYNKKGDTVASAITNFDLHDIARVAKTYGIQRLYVINPFRDQKRLAQRILDHWLKGQGNIYNPVRAEALELVDIVHSLEEAIQDIIERAGYRPKLVVTDAKMHSNCTSYPAAREMLCEGDTYLILFGTAWGIAKEVIERADYILTPIRGNSNYNHLSVRSATAIVLDRLLGDNR